ncbi:MAG: hypothetical protein J0L57_20170, partial [Burkholderiales bacterium]|nr:hypothetical protein [Burkholderiales bacterium]
RAGRSASTDPAPAEACGIVAGTGLGVCPAPDCRRQFRAWPAARPGTPLPRHPGLGTERGATA